LYFLVDFLKYDVQQKFVGQNERGFVSRSTAKISKMSTRSSDQWRTIYDGLSEIVHVGRKAMPTQMQMQQRNNTDDGSEFTNAINNIQISDIVLDQSSVSFRSHNYSLYQSKYMNINFSDNFRLVTHQPNLQHKFGVELVGAMCTTEYWAISYEWGFITNRTDYGCGWLSPERHANAIGDIVRLVHDKIGHHALWMDALCVDQSSITDKESQIPLMGKYYNSCIGTVIKLTGLYEMEFMVLEALADEMDMFVKKIGRMGDIKDMDMYESLDEVLSAISRICDDSWFTRVWTMQEYMLPKKVVLLDNVGNMLDGDAFEKCTSISYIHDHLVQLGKIERAFSKNMTGMRQIWSKLDRIPSISRILKNIQGRKCGVEEDYVYGVLGLLQGNYVVKYGIGLSNAAKSIIVQSANQGDITGLMSEAATLDDVSGYTFRHDHDMWSNIPASSHENIFTFRNVEMFPEVSRVILSEPREPMHPDRLGYRIWMVLNEIPMLGMAIIAAFWGTHPTSKDVETIANVGRQIQCTSLDCMNVWRNNLEDDLGLLWYQIVFKASDWASQGRGLYVSELMVDRRQCFVMWVGYPTNSRLFGHGVDIHCRANDSSKALMMIASDNGISHKIGVCSLNPTIRFVQGYIAENMDIKFR
jgi:hypothetical protein